MRRLLRKCIWILPVGIVLGFALLLAALALPAGALKAREAEAAAIIKEEGPYPPEVYSQRQMDNNTDSLMLLEAADDGPESLIDRAVNAYYTAEKGKAPDGTLVGRLEPGRGEGYRHAYARYWHGFLIFLKPTYALLGYSGIRTLNLAIQYGLLTAILLLIQRRYPRGLLPLLLMILLLAPSAIGKSLQFSSVYYVILAECLLLLWNPRDSFSGERVWRLFLLAGMMTAYLDLLTYPTAAMTAPLTLVCLEEVDGGRPAKQGLKRVLGCVLFWGLGYAGMWAGKWLIAALFTGGAFVKDLFATMHLRASATNGLHDHVSRGRALWVNVRMLFVNRHLLILSAFYALSQAALCLHRRVRIGRETLSRLALLLIPAAVAAAWVLLLSNHSTVHCWFTYRTLAPAVFSLLSALSLAAGNPGREREKRNG